MPAVEFNRMVDNLLCQWHENRDGSDSNAVPSDSHVSDGCGLLGDQAAISGEDGNAALHIIVQQTMTQAARLDTLGQEIKAGLRAHQESVDSIRARSNAGDSNGTLVGQMKVEAADIANKIAKQRWMAWNNLDDFEECTGHQEQWDQTNMFADHLWWRSNGRCAKQAATNKFLLQN